MDKPDLKNDRFVRWGQWAVLMLFVAQPVASVAGAKGLRLPLFCALVAVAVVVAVYVITKSYREGYKKFALRMALYMAIIVLSAGLLAWALLTTPGALDGIF